MTYKIMNGRLLSILSSGKGLLFKNLAFYIVDLEDEKTELLVKMQVSFKKKIFSRIRFTNRLMRLEPKCVGQLSEKQFVFCMFGKLWLLDIIEKHISTVTEVRKGFTVLNFCEYSGALYFGDYGINKNYEAINIYRFSSDLKLEIVYTFKCGQIRHIHNIIADSKNNRIWIFAGDNEPQAGIFYTDNNFGCIKTFAIGSQNYRTVVGFPFKNGLIYATDSVEKNNSIFILNNKRVLKSICEINGSCIYGIETKRYYIFSTTVESPEGKGIKALFSNKLGGGIKSRDVHIVSIDKQTLQPRIIAKYRKDHWPMKLLQYGRIIFPTGQKESNDLWGYNVACKKMDGKSFKIEL